MRDKHTIEELSAALGTAPGSTSYLLRKANSKMIRGMAEKMNISLYYALMHYASFVEEEYASMYDQILPDLQEDIKQEVLRDKIQK